METTLHLGAHRTATTSFQSYLRTHRDALDALHIGFWGPWRTRNGLLHGVAERPTSEAQSRRARGRLRLALEAARRQGVTRLVVSDENMMGSARRCLRASKLYPGVGERVARLSGAFGNVRTISLQIRAQDLWWASAIAYLLPRGERMPDAARIAAIADSPRNWRDVITDLACACPEAEIVVTPFERFADRPDRLLANMTGCPRTPVARPGEFWRNRHLTLPALRETLLDRGEDPGQLPEGEGRFMPFDDRQRAALREAYADDLFWLESGAEGLAKLTYDADPTRPHPALVRTREERGRGHDGFARRLAPNR